MVIDSLKKGFFVAGKSFSVLLVLFFVGFVSNLLNVFLGKGTDNYAPSQWAAVSIAAIAVIILSIFTQAGSLGYALAVVKNGSATMTDFTAAGKKYFLRLLGLGLVLSIVLLALTALIMFSVALLLETMFALGVTLSIFLGAIMICFIVLVLLAPYAIVASDKKVMASVGHSVSTVRSCLSKILGLLGMIFLVGLGVGLVVGGLQFGLGLAIQNERVLDVIMAFMGAVVSSYISLVAYGAFMNLYLRAELKS